jgi:uncharacterized protein (TIGR02270 family)
LEVIRTIIDQHAADAAFLWLLRDRMVSQPHFLARDLASLDERIEGHLDGLRIAGEAGWLACQDALQYNEPGEIFTAAVMAFTIGEDGRINDVLQACCGTPELTRGVVSALGWLAYDQAEAHIRDLLASNSPALRRIGLAGAAVHRRDPGKALIDALTDSDPLIRARALRSVGELGRNDLQRRLELNLTAEDDECRFWAAWSSVLLGYRQGLPALRAFISSSRSDREQALSLALRRTDPDAALDWQQKLSQEPGSVRLAVIGAGATGDPRLVLWLFDKMATPDLARAAADAFAMITGADLQREHLDCRKPEDSVLSDDTGEESAKQDPDDGLPWPAPEAIKNWWTKHHSDFSNEQRYLLGKPIAESWLREVLRTGRQRQRAAAAMELVLLHPGQPLFEIRAPGFRQQQLLRP